MTNQVVDDRARLRNDTTVVCDDRRFAERMNRLELWRGEARLRIAFVQPQLVRQRKLLQQPQYPLRTRVVEMVNDDHVFPAPVGAKLRGLAARQTRGAPNDLRIVLRCLASIEHAVVAYNAYPSWARIAGR